MVAKLGNEIWFPPVQSAEMDGLLAYGGNLSTERLLLAYRSGIFPWFSPDEEILWWCPNPRFVLYPNQLKISSTMRQILRKNTFNITYNKEFEKVMTNCGTTIRSGEQGTWISQEMIQAYTKLFDLGHVKSVEVWQDGELVGGLYGLMLGNVFFGESMFSKVSNASKAGFITFIQNQIPLGLHIIDCQVYTPHLESLGARMIDRELFLSELKNNI